MIVLTGAAGFIGSCLLKKLNLEGHRNILLSDEFEHEEKNLNLLGKRYIGKVDREDLHQWIDRMHASVEVVFHIGARTDTTEQDVSIFDHLNLNFSKKLWEQCADYGIPLLYASSAATYGLGEKGYSDRHDIVDELQPLNPYGRSKNDFDRWALQQEQAPSHWYGFKFFNVYGPNEYHKGRMASVIFHTARQIKATGEMKLFRSHRPDFRDGEQRRDFIYVKDVVDVLYWFWRQRPENGLYNLGTGKARTFYDLAANTFEAMEKEPNIQFIDTPADIRDTYQYFTEADMTKLRAAGYDRPFHSLEEGIQDYVSRYLKEEKIW